MGADGYDASNYTSTFGGTSSATPLVAGIAAVIIADNLALTSVEVRAILRDGTDKIGPYAYSGGRNDYYGYGRVNLLNSVYSCLLSVKIDRVIPAYYSSLQDAYDSAGDGETILSQTVIFTEDLLIDLNKSVVLEGGYDCSYTTIIGKTTLNGNMTISDGTLTIENFELQ